jgi:hypothetical protein
MDLQTFTLVRVARNKKMDSTAEFSPASLARRVLATNRLTFPNKICHISDAECGSKFSTSNFILITSESEKFPSPSGFQSASRE